MTLGIILHQNYFYDTTHVRLDVRPFLIPHYRLVGVDGRAVLCTIETVVGSGSSRF